jgi:N-acetylglucosaminyldiphosphoundecaprenol N-acetyl-beta-D-mannosaminyltransferase
MSKNINLLGYKVYADSIEKIKFTSNKQIINTLNPHSYITAKSDKLFNSALLDSDILLADGSGIVLAARQINNSSIEKIAGSDLHIHLINLLNKKHGKVFYMGSSKTTLENIKNRLKIEYPNIKSEFYSPPFKDTFSKFDNDQIIDAINQFNPDVLFVGMTAPKQEKWLHKHEDQIDAKILCCIGAVFDFYAGTIKRPSQFWINIHLEWLPRLLNEPKRLWKRNFVSTPLFLWDIVLYKVRLKK